MSVKVAMVPSGGLGDGLIQLAAAHNLFLNGLEVVYFSNFVYQLRGFIDGVRLSPLPKYQNIQSAFGAFDFILYDSNSHFMNDMPEVQSRWLAENGICYSLARAKPRHVNISLEKLRIRCSQEAMPWAKKFIRLNRSFRTAGLTLSGKSLAIHLVDTFAQIFSLKKISYECCVKVARETGATEPKRVLVHPTSNSHVKNWRPEQFLALCDRLTGLGWRPVFTLAPYEYTQWEKIVGNRYEIKVFENLADLARYYVASGAFIGNDSGNAHLASCLGLPSLVIFGRWRRYPPWRPAWGLSRVVSPKLPAPGDWRDRVSVERVYQAFSELLADESKGV